jgi:hypothetical protein
MPRGIPNKPRVPGAVPVTPAETAETREAATTGADDVVKPAETVETTVTVSGEEFAAIQAKLAQLESAVKAGGGAGAAAKRAQRQNLKDAAEIDAAKLEKPTLSRQGWIVPPSFGGNPAKSGPAL